MHDDSLSSSTQLNYQETGCVRRFADLLIRFCRATKANQVETGLKAVKLATLGRTFGMLGAHYRVLIFDQWREVE